ncbi:MAG: protein kinase, partial [Acidobacteria bacterium]|nr:protein kinase [Acidobacteriota bacterium]
MNAEQWRQIKEVCIAALRRAPHKRIAYLEKACHGDSLLLTEVRSLLSFEAQAEKINKLPSDLVMAAFGTTSALIGCRIGNYLVRSLLGRGGMGEVYLAEDIDLRREVALKVLPKVFNGDEQPLQRFKQEARAASGLKHRNIITIYSVGQQDGVYFIAAEYVPGLT